MFIFLFSPTLWADWLIKNPRLTWQSRVLEILCLCLEVPSHDAVMASGAMPHSRLASDSLDANANLSGRDHLLTGVNKADPDDIVKPLQRWGMARCAVRAAFRGATCAAIRPSLNIRSARRTRAVTAQRAAPYRFGFDGA
jgi:hypothetical protein